MKSKIFLSLFIIIVLLEGIYLWNQKQKLPTGFDKSVSNGEITISYNGAIFGLATIQSQILVTSYIPSCDPAFDYCLYYNGEEYKGTNFESAGIRIQKRSDMASENSCINTPPDGYSIEVKPDQLSMESSHTSSVFKKVGDAGAGHVASGSLYRLFVKKSSSCYEIQTRIGQTQFANYPAGSIKEFTPDLLSGLNQNMDIIVKNVSFSSGEKNLFP